MKIKSILSGKLEFDNGTKLSIFHEEDDWERYWADFLALKQYNVNPITGKHISIFDIDFQENEKLIKPIRDEGFCLKAKDGSTYFVPCYEENNGYYNNNFSLKIETIGKKTKYVNLTSCCNEQSDEKLEEKYNSLTGEEKMLLCKWMSEDMSAEEWIQLFSKISEEEASNMYFIDELKALYTVYLENKYQEKECDEYC